jgi:site-specific recombinase XerD
MAEQVISTEKLTADNARLSAVRNGGQEIARQGMERVQELALKSRAGSTLKSYDSDWRSFELWGLEHQHQTLPAAPTTVALYLAHLTDRGLKASTIRRHLASISVRHQLAGYDETNPARAPQVSAVMKGIAREGRGRPTRKATAATLLSIRTLVDGLGERPADLRDRAIILVGFAGALRRSEVVAIDAELVTLDAGGLLIRIPHSKTDQEGAGMILGLPYGAHQRTCPVRAYLAWMDRSGIATGPVFRPVNRHGHILGRRLGDRAVADMLHRRALAAGLEGAYSGHSLRAGFATEAYRQGVPELAVMRHGRWRSSQVMRGYVQEGRVWSDNAAAELGL